MPWKVISSSLGRTNRSFSENSVKIAQNYPLFQVLALWLLWQYIPLFCSIRTITLGVQVCNSVNTSFFIENLLDYLQTPLQLPYKKFFSVLPSFFCVAKKQSHKQKKKIEEFVV